MEACMRKVQSGGRLSSEILQVLDRSRFGGLAAGRASRTKGDLEWRPAQVGSIQRDDQRATWQTGNVQAVLCDGQAIIAGAQTGGVWLINPIPSPSFRDGYRAIPLSDRWDTPNVRSLAYGPDGPQHVFVGCGEADSLFLIEFQAVPGALVVKQSDLMIALPLRTTVNAIVVINSPRRIVVGTMSGALWSDIPASVHDVAGYSWQPAAGLPLGECGALAHGPGTSVVASGSDPDSAPTVNGPPQIDRIFVGDWRNGTLVFEPAAVPPIAQTQFIGAVLTSCAAERQRVYATAMNNATQIRCVLRSDTGGRTWTAVSIPDGAGEQGYHNRAIAVSPYRPDVVALGWQTGGPFLSLDGGSTWRGLSGGNGLDGNGLPCRGGKQGLHDDLHALSFSLNAQQTDQLVVTSDGGVVTTHDLGRCFDSQYNRSLAVLQFYGPGHHPSFGTLAVSSRFPGLLAGGTQDNGNLTLHPDADAGAVWHQLVGGDGGMTRFVDPLGALLHTLNSLPQVRLTTWDDAARRFPNGAGSLVPVDGDPSGFAAKCLETVVAPTWRRGGQLLYACGGSTNGDVHGLFADADGGRASFLRLANVDTAVTAVASLSGAEIVVGLEDGRIRLLDSMSGVSRELPRDATVPVGSGGIERFEILAPNLAYGLTKGQIIRFDGQAWTAVAAPQYWTIFTAEQGSGRLFAASERDVFTSTDGGRTWSDASVGLPAMPYCTDLRIGDDADGGRTLYLTTYGRSAWRAKITLPSDDGSLLELPPQAREILFRVIEEGGGIIRLGEQLIGIAARQPALDILAGLAIDSIAQRMSPELSRAIRLTTLRQLALVVARTIDAIDETS
jgi:hypothetical protein